MDTPQLHRGLGDSSAGGASLRRRILVVDDDPSLRLLLRTTLAADEFEVEEVASAEEASDAARFRRPSVVLLDVTLPGMDGLAFCKRLTEGPTYGQPTVIPLTEAVDTTLLDDPGLEYGFLLHDIGKIAIPNHILEKPGPLNPAEWKVMQAHPKIGAEILSDVTLLEGHGVDVVRSHHERWDGTGYPDGLAGADIPLGARIFALADALDAMTSDRPYRRALGWKRTTDEILGGNGGQFDPRVVRAFSLRERRLRRIFDELWVVPT